jgi:hypothetical protein
MFVHLAFINDLLRRGSWIGFLRLGVVWRWYKEYVKQVFPPPHVYACAVSQLPRHLLGRFLSLHYLAVVN